MKVIHGIRIAAAAALAVLVSSAAPGGCADSGACTARADHALLQARAQLHNPSRRAVKDYSNLQKLMRDCAEFGVCDEPAPLTAERWSLLQEKQKMRKAKWTLLQEKENMRKTNVADDVLGQEVHKLEGDTLNIEQKLDTLQQEVTNLEVLKQATKADTTKVAFDCGSSGTTAMIVSQSEECAKQLKSLEAIPYIMISHINACKTETEESCGAKGAPSEGCNVVAAFSELKPEEKLSGGCSEKWAKIQEWAAELDKCFTSTTECWGAATAGNRLVSKDKDIKGWVGFKTWATRPGDGGLCGKFLKGKFTSNSQTETIPGTMEAAMEVETLIEKEQGNVDGTARTDKKPLLAFGSAGGSSAQFGIRLSSAVDPASAKEDWEKLVEFWRDGFKKANYPSDVDRVDGDYLNTYRATDGSVWGVGSFLGNDKCDGDGTTTPMGGINAMKCGMIRKTGWAAAKKYDIAWKATDSKWQGEWDALTVGDMEATMKGSAQGKFAADVNAFINNPGLWGDRRDSANAFRCVAKIHLMLDKQSNKEDNYKTVKLVKPESWSHGIKLAYAYMSVLGFIPTQEFLSQMDQGEKDFAWLDTAAKLGIEGRSGDFTDPVAPGESTGREMQANGVTPLGV